MKFQRIPIIIDAIQWTGQNTNEILKYFNSDITPKTMCGGEKILTINTFDSETRVLLKKIAYINDWIIKDDKNKIFPCNPILFKQTYKVIEE